MLLAVLQWIPLTATGGEALASFVAAEEALFARNWVFSWLLTSSYSCFSFSRRNRTYLHFRQTLLGVFSHRASSSRFNITVPSCVGFPNLSHTRYASLSTLLHTAQGFAITLKAMRVQVRMCAITPKPLRLCKLQLHSLDQGSVTPKMDSHPKRTPRSDDG